MVQKRLQPIPEQNNLLAAISEPVRERLRYRLESVEMSNGDILYESGSPLYDLYFPTAAVISLQHVINAGATTEITIVGNVGFLGNCLFMSGDTTTNRAIVATCCARIPAEGGLHHG